MKTREQSVPRARKEGLVVQDMPDELLVYDVDRHKAHCLNQTAALVWKRCDGKTSVIFMCRNPRCRSPNSIGRSTYTPVRKLDN